MLRSRAWPSALPNAGAAGKNASRAYALRSSLKRRARRTGPRGSSASASSAAGRLVDGLGLHGKHVDAVDRVGLGAGRLDLDRGAVGDGEDAADDRDAGRAGRAGRVGVGQHELRPGLAAAGLSRRTAARAARRAASCRSRRSTGRSSSSALSVDGTTPPPQLFVRLSDSSLRLAFERRRAERGEVAAQLRLALAALDRRADLRRAQRLAVRGQVLDGECTGRCARRVRA